jgi:hypothetical protein
MNLLPGLTTLNLFAVVSGEYITPETPALLANNCFTQLCTVCCSPSKCHCHSLQRRCLAYAML